jgi:HSP20 family protein
MNNTLECTNTNGTGEAQSQVAHPQSKVTFTPRFDVWENDQEYVLAGDLPGVDPQDVEVRYENQELTIHGKVAPRYAEARYFGVEYGVGDFHRGFRLNETIDGEGIAAELKGGVLTVRLPKRIEVRPRKISVQAG